jgi:hypothetical protein
MREEGTLSGGRGARRLRLRRDTAHPRAFVDQRPNLLPNLGIHPLSDKWFDSTPE